MGERDLSLDRDFSKWGRVQYMLHRRQVLLEDVERMASSLGVEGDVSCSCETAGGTKSGKGASVA